MNYQKVIVPLDGSELAECVLSHLEAIASNCKVTTVELVRVVSLVELRYWASMSIDAAQEKKINAEAKKEAQEYLDSVKSKLDASRMQVTATVLTGKVEDALLEHIEKSDADLLVIATHGRSGPGKWIMGSVAEKLVRHTCVPVFMIRPPGCIPGFK